MKRQVKLGIGSILLLASVYIYPKPTWREPVSFACLWLSAILGALAARDGSKWWLVIPVFIVLAAAFGLFLAFHSY